MKFESGSSIWGPKFDKALGEALKKRSGQMDGVVPPPPILPPAAEAAPATPAEKEKKRQGVDWNAKLEKFREVRDKINQWGEKTDSNFDAAFQDIKQNLAGNRKEAYLKHNKKKTSLQEGLTIGSAAIAEIPFLGPIYGLVVLAGGTAVMGVKELSKMKKLKGSKEEEGYWNRSAGVQTIRAVGEVLRHRGTVTAKGKREIGKKLEDIEDLQLTNAEVALAGLVGFSASFVSMALLSDVSLVSVLPIVGMKAMRRLATPILTSLIARGFASMGAGYYNGLVRKAELSEPEAGKRKEQFVEQCLRVNAPVIQALTLGSMSLGVLTTVDWSNLGHQVGELLQNLRKPETVTPTKTAIPLAAAAGTQLPGNYSGDEPWKDMAKHHFDSPVAPPPETPPPPSDFGWHAGEAVDSALLENAASQGHLIDPAPMTISILGHELQLYGFDLDSDSNRDVLAIKDEQGNYTPVIWETFGGFYKVDLPNDDLGPLNYPGDVFKQDGIDIFQVGGRGGGGEFTQNLQGGQNWDLDNDGDDDVIPQADGSWFIDRNDNNSFDDQGDILLAKEPVFNQTDGKVLALEADDGQKWWRGTDGKMMGLVFQHNHWWLDHGVDDYDPEDPLSRPYDGANPLVPEAFSSGGIEVKAANIGNFELKQTDEQAFRLVLKGAVVEFRDGSQWQYDASGDLVSGDSDNKGCVLANGRTLAFDRAGDKGIMAWQYQLALAHPDWTPDEVGKEAFRHQSEPININLSRPEPYRAPSGSLTFDQLAMGPRGGDEGIIMHDVHEVNGNLNATQVAQVAHIAVVNNNLSGPAMIHDVNTTIARFNLESTFGQIMKDSGIRDEWITNYARQAAFTAIKDNIAWQIPNDKIFNGSLDSNSLQIFSTHDYSWWEDWLRQNGYIN